MSEVAKVALVTFKDRQEAWDLAHAQFVAFYGHENFVMTMPEAVFDPEVQRDFGGNIIRMVPKWRCEFRARPHLATGAPNPGRTYET